MKFPSHHAMLGALLPLCVYIDFVKQHSKRSLLLTMHCQYTKKLLLGCGTWGCIWACTKTDEFGQTPSLVAKEL